jgi:hypothetical protein
MSDVDWDLLKRELQAALGGVIDRLAAADQGSSDVRIEALTEGVKDWMYRWPDGKEELYDTGSFYWVSGPSGRSRVLLARTVRTVRDEPRRRYVVFAQYGGPKSKTFYPWTEFVATDTADYAAIIPNPARPRAALTATDPLPARLTDRRVARTDELYRNVASGPSLRVVVSESDVEEMLKHGYWVAELRRHLRGRPATEPGS